MFRILLAATTALTLMSGVGFAQPSSSSTIASQGRRARASKQFVINELLYGTVVARSPPLIGGSQKMPNADFVTKHAENAHGTSKPTLTAMEAMFQLVDLKMEIHRFEVAFNNLIQGVCFYDRSRTLVLANRRYAEIYCLPLECIRVGATLAGIVEHRFAVGAMPNMSVEEYLHWRAEIQNEGLLSDTIVKLTNGRTILIHRRPMPDQGWVSTHEDITARLNREANTAEAIAELTKSDPQSDSAPNVPIVAFLFA